MKLFILAIASAFLTRNNVAAFAPPVKKGVSPSFPVASTIGANDAYRNTKPLSTPKSTTPVPTKKLNWIQKQMLPDVMIDPDFSLTWQVALLGPLIWWYHPCEYTCLQQNEKYMVLVAHTYIYIYIVLYFVYIFFSLCY